MATKNKVKIAGPESIEKTALGEKNKSARPLVIPPWLSSHWIQASIVAAIAFVFYANTIQNEFALDDYAVIVKNEYVYEGFAGLKGIFTQDTYDSYYRQMHNTNELTGGRYRPLSVATFAIEQEFFGTVPKKQVDSVMRHTEQELYDRKDQVLLSNTHTRHLINVLWFALSMAALLYFLRVVVFRDSPLAAFIATLLFAVHPIHTEVVANLKGRDEILSLLCISLTFIFAFKYEDDKNHKRWLFLSLLFYFLALLSKEYAVCLLFLLPLSLHLFRGYPVSRAVTSSAPFICVMAIWGYIRWHIIEPVIEEGAKTVSILADPYAYATASEKSATLLATPVYYLKLLIFPHPLSADYSYNSIPYKDFSSPVVWLSICVHAALVAGFFYYLKRNKVLSFAIAFYFVHLILVSNIIFNIGGTMGERLIYTSSVGFVIVLAYLILKGIEHIKSGVARRVLFYTVMVSLLTAYGFTTIERNANWKNNDTLFLHDVNVVPNSVLANCNTGIYYTTKSNTENDEKARRDDLNKAIEYFNKAISLDELNATSYYNKAIVCLKLELPDSTVACVRKLKEISPTYPQMQRLYFDAGKIFTKKKEYSKAKLIFESLLRAYPKNVEIQNAIKTANDSLATRKLPNS